MALFELTADGDLRQVPQTTFGEQKILERSDLQRALREHIEVLDDRLLVVAEEFGGFEVRRRIDLLCVDRSGRLVVVELKRTEDGGHMELQALRYAAMVSAMTFDQLADTYEGYLHRTAPSRAEMARASLAEFLDAGEDAVLERRVGILLVSAGFDPQITTTVLWLNDVYGLDITCVRLTPYRVEGKLVLDVQQVIPLPEAAELMVRLRQREAARAVVTAAGADWTPYVIETPAGPTEPLRKRRAVLALVHALHNAGVSGRAMAAAIPGSLMLPVVGQLEGAALLTAFLEANPNLSRQEDRWFLDEPIQDRDLTWVLSKMWGTNTVPALDALLELAPTEGFAYHPVPTGGM